MIVCYCVLLCANMCVLCVSACFCVIVCMCVGDCVCLVFGLCCVSVCVGVVIVDMIMHVSVCGYV